jgi:hypothetical protein
LALDLLGSVAKTGAGTLVLNNDVALYKASPPTLQPFQINGGTVAFGANSSLYGSLMQVAAGTNLSVMDKFLPTIGALSGAGTVEFNGHPAVPGDVTGLNIDTPLGMTSVFSGVFNGGGVTGQGGMIVVIGQGTTVLSSINPDGTGIFNITQTLGSLYINGEVYGHQLLVVPGSASSAAFGGLATMHFTGLVKFDSNANIVATINGTGAGQFTQINDTDTTDANPVDLGGSRLVVSLGYTPTAGNTNSIITATAANAIIHSFANAANGQILVVGGVHYQVSATGTSFSLAVPSNVTLGPTQLVVTQQPPADINAQTPFPVAVAIANQLGNPTAFSGNVSVALASNPSVILQTVPVSGGASALFTGLTINNAGSYSLVFTANGLTSATSNPFIVLPVGTTPPPQSQAPEVVGATVVRMQKTNKKGKPVGRAVIIGYQFTFNEPMNSSISNPSNFQVQLLVPGKGRGKRAQPPHYQATGFSLKPISSTQVQVLTGSRTNKTFKKGGRIMVGTGIQSAAGTPLGSNVVYNISPGGGNITG